MNTKILIAGFASLSLFAAAQSQSNEKKQEPKASTEMKSPRDHASGQASGRRMNQHAQDEATIARDVSTGKATGKTMAQTGNSANVKSVSAASRNSGSSQGAASTAGHSDVKSPRDSSTGMATSKRQHGDIRVHKASDKAPQK